MIPQRNRSTLLKPAASEWAYRRNNKRRNKPVLGLVGDALLDERLQGEYVLELRAFDRHERGVRDVTNFAWRTTHYWHSRKNGRRFVSESQHEAAYGTLLDAEFEQLTYRTQPLKIPFPSSKTGNMRKYTPDFEVLRGDARYLIEVKVDEFIANWRDRERDNAIAKFCAENNYHYAIVPTSEIYKEPRASNAKRIEQSYWIHVDAHLIAKICDVVSAGATTVGGILTHLADLPVDINVLCALHARSLLKLDYTKPFTSSSTVLLP